MGDRQIKALSLSRLSWPWSSNSGRQSGRVGLAVAPGGLAVAWLNASGQLEHCRFYSQSADVVEQLKTVIKELDIDGQVCSVVLHPAYYQLLLAEAPSVQGAEMTKAVRWKIKELLDYSLELAAVSHFMLPADAYRGRQKMLYAAAMKKSLLQELVEPIEMAGLAVDCIEISELALHNLTRRLPTTAGGTALVQLYEGGGFINLMENGEIYLSRRLDVGLDQYTPAGDNQTFFDALYLEVQRSLDFYESQLGKGIITELFYSPGLPETADIGQFLSEQLLGLNVSVLDLTPLNLVATLDEELDEQMALCASAIGAALGPCPDDEAYGQASGNLEGSESKEMASAAS